MLKIAFFLFQLPPYFSSPRAASSVLDPSSSVSPCPFDGLSFVNPFKMSAANDDAVSPIFHLLSRPFRNHRHTPQSWWSLAGGCLRRQSSPRIAHRAPPLAPPVVWSFADGNGLLLAQRTEPESHHVHPGHPVAIAASIITEALDANHNVPHI